MYNEISPKNIRNYCKYYGWYPHETSETVTRYSCSKLIDGQWQSAEFVLRNNDDSVQPAEIQLAIETIAKFENRPAWVVAGLIYEMWNDSTYRTIRIDNFGVVKKIVPVGPYCYDKNGLCPFWDSWDHMGKHNNGYCSYLEKGDWMHKDGTMHLFDQTKVCGINDVDEVEDIKNEKT
jgi:hypothetical protein